MVHVLTPTVPLYRASIIHLWSKSTDNKTLPSWLTLGSFNFVGLINTAASSLPDGYVGLGYEAIRPELISILAASTKDSAKVKKNDNSHQG